MRTVINVIIAGLSLYIIFGWFKHLERLICMTTKETVDAIDAATTALGDTITSKTSEIAQELKNIVPGMTQADVDALNQRLQDHLNAINTNAEAVKAIGSDPNNPVPPLP